MRNDERPDGRVGLLRRAAAVILSAVLLLAPLPLGSNRDWGWSPLAVATAIALVTFAAATLHQSERAAPFSVSIAVSMAAMAVVLAWGLAQALPWGGSSSLASFRSSAESVLGVGFAKHESLDSERALTGIMRLMTYCGVFWLAAQLSHDRRFARIFSLAVVISAVLSTLYGWATDISTRSCVILSYVKMERAAGLSCPFSGTFVNSSNYADYASLASLVCLAHLQGLLLDAGSSARGARARWRMRLLVLTGSGALYLAALFVLVGGVVYSASKASLASFLAAMLAMTVLTGALRRQRTGALIATSLGVIVIAVALVGEGVVRRSLVLLTEGDSVRSDLFELTGQAIGARPWTGWGLGSFEALYSVFQPTSLYLSFDKVHNTYLESALELGVPISLALVLAVAAPAVRCLRGLRARSRDAHFCAAAVGATVLIALHSTVDFGIQIPAVAVAFSTILGVGWAQSWSSRAIANS